jgi:4-diphosphocytidyl-2-C-methyl-D-erythritol kinase
MLTLLAPAKINLALNVISKRADGYHEVDMIMQTIALADQLSFVNHHRIELSCTNQRLPLDSDNLVWKAVSLLKEETRYPGGVKIHLTKNIPIAAGLAGGSADAAATLTGLNELWGLGLTRDQLMKIGVKLGADVPFCILRGTARAKGIGAELTGINSGLASELLLVTPDMEVPTPLIYRKLQLDHIQSRPRIEQAIDALENGDLLKLYSYWGNVLEAVAVKEFPDILLVKGYFQKYGLIPNLMSGSGPSVFALNPPREMVAPFLKELPNNWFGCLTHFVIGDK